MGEIREIRQSLPDPMGMIARVRSRLNKKCAVRQSKYCDWIISMRMQGIPFREIEDWLSEQGEQYRISSPTIWRNFKNTKMEIKLSYAEEMIERMGGTLQLDLVREMQQNIIVQKERIDRLVRAELEKRKQPGQEHFSDRRIRAELTLQHEMVGQLHKLLVEAPKDANDARKAADEMERQGISLAPAAADALTELILSGQLAIGPNALLPDS